MDAEKHFKSQVDQLYIQMIVAALDQIDYVSQPRLFVNRKQKRQSAIMLLNRLVKNARGLRGANRRCEIAF